jgi:hypothetical protein
MGSLDSLPSGLRKMREWKIRNDFLARNCILLELHAFFITVVPFVCIVKPVCTYVCICTTIWDFSFEQPLSCISYFFERLYAQLF